MGNLGDLIPAREDAELRRQRDAERRQQEEAAARRASATQIGNGGRLKVDGTLEVTGDLEVPDGTLSSSGNMTAGVDVVAGRDVTAGRDVVATSQVRGDNGLFPGGINSVDVYSRLVTGSGSFRTVSANVLGQLGQTVSSVKYKQDVETAVIPREVLRQLRVVFFRYVAREPFSQEAQPLLLGLIAEEVHALGLTWLVVYDENDEPEALVDFALPYLGLLLAQFDADDIDELRTENAELRDALAALTERVAALEP